MIDEWGYEYTDDDDRRHYETFGNLIQVQNADKIEVEKMTENFIISGRAGNCLTEDKPTYKEKFEQLQKENEELKRVVKTSEKIFEENERLKEESASFMNGDYCVESCKKMNNAFRDVHKAILKQDEELKQKYEKLYEHQGEVVKAYSLNKNKLSLYQHALEEIKQKINDCLYCDCCECKYKDFNDCRTRLLKDFGRIISETIGE